MRKFYTVLLAIAMFAGFVETARCQDSTKEVEQLKAALQSNPDDIASRLQLINLLFLNKDYSEVIDNTYLAIKALPERSSLYYFMGVSFQELGNYNSAYTYLSKGYSIRPYPDLSEAYGMVLVHMGKSEEAAPILQKVAAEKTSFVEDHYNAGVTAYNQGRTKDATDQLLAVYLVDKSKLTNEQVLFVKFNENFQSYVTSGNTDAAVSAFTMTLKGRFQGNYDFTATSELFKSLIQEKRIEDARRLFETFNTLPLNAFSQTTIDTNFLFNAHDLVLKFPALRNLSKSIFHNLVKENIALNETELAPLYSLYDFLIGQGATGLAADLAKKVVNGSNGLRDPYLRLADIFAWANRYDESAQALTGFFIASKLDQLGYTADFVKSYRQLLTQNKPDVVASVLGRLGELNPQNLVPTYIMLGDFFVKMGNGERAIGILNKVVAVDPGNHVASVKLGEAYYSAGQYDNIIRFLGNTTDSTGLRYLALAYEKRMELSEANKSWQSIIAEVQDTARINEANEHIRQNTITMMSPEYQHLKAMAMRPASSPVQLAIVQPAGAVEDNSRGISLVTSDVPSVTFSGFAGASSPIDTIMVNGILVKGDTASQAEAAAANITAPYIVKFSTSLNLPPAQASEVEVVTTDSLGNRAAKKYVVQVQAQKQYNGGLPAIRAFVVGISKYSDKSLDLKYAQADANLFYERLRDPTTIGIPASNMVLLTNSSATRAGILEGLESVFNNSFEGDVVLIYFAMHGVTEDNLLYFVPYDAQLTSLRATAISSLDIDYLIKSKGVNRKVIMFVDACHSGGAASSLVFGGGTRGVSALPLLLNEMAKSQPGLAVFSASDVGQVSMEGEQWGGHGVFTYYLLKAMTTPAANTNADQFIQLREIVDYVRDRVSADTKGKQTPVFKCFSCDPNMPLFYSK